MEKIKFFTLLLLLCLTIACEKVIDLDLEDANTQVAIEANLIAPENLLKVDITKTASYFDSAPPVVIENAEITLRDDEGNSFFVPHITGSRYELVVEAEPGRMYTLSVDIDGQIFEASSQLMEKIEITAIDAEFEEASGPIEEGFQIFVRFNDPGGVDNFYRILHTLNGVPQKEGDDLNVINDVLFDGGNARRPLFRKVFDPGDTLLIELVHFDKISYDYYNSLADIIGGGGGPAGGSAAPGNPNSNWSGNALGYFSTYNLDAVEKILE